MADKPSGAQREAEKRARQRERVALQSEHLLAAQPSVDEIFAGLRSGAANVAGVTYQVSLAALLLVGGRSNEKDLPRVVAVRPEGFEDIDLRLNDGSWLLVQSKQRGGARPISIAEIAKIIVHASHVEAGRDYAADVAGFAIVTNGSFGLEASGWGTPLSHHAGLANALRANLADAGRDPDGAEELIARTRLVVTPDLLATPIESQLITAFDIAPVVATIARARLISDLAQLSAAQRGNSASSAFQLNGSDVDAIVNEVRGTLDLGALDAALRTGVCELVNFAREPSDSAAQFFAGVRVVPGHVGFNRDVVRPRECMSVIEALSKSRHVLIVGPSGTGKSGLLWRSVYMVEDGPILLRVLRVESGDDVEQLLAYVKVLAPSQHRRVLICVDDIGRSSTDHWPGARDRLLEISGVSVVGACRQEDLLPSIASGATLVDSRLTADSATRIYDRLIDSGLQIEAEPEEAISRAQGLLMEFIAIATTGRRLREVLRSQVADLRLGNYDLAVEVLGIVAALHTLGRPVDADQIPHVVGQSSGKISKALMKLQDEHLVVTDDGTHWRGLHDLRAEVILQVIHETPPPTIGATYAAAISTAPTDARPVLYRRAAIRLVRGLRLHSGVDVRTALSLCHRALTPLVGAICAQVRAHASEMSRRAAIEIAALVDAAERLDVAAYVAATLALVQQGMPTTVELSNYYILAYSSKFGGIFNEIQDIRHIVALGESLPDWDSSARRQVLDCLSDDSLVEVLSRSAIDEAVRFGERLEGFRQLPREQVKYVYEVYDFKEPPTIDRADVLAQLVATLSVLAGARGARLGEIFGPVEDRAIWAVASDDHGFAARVEFLDRAMLPESVSGLSRPHVYDDVSFCKVFARAFIRSEAVARGYTPQHSQDSASVNAQAVFLAQRIFDACPEADLVEVEIVTPNLLAPMDGSKILRAGVVPRRVSIERSIAVQVAVSDLRSAERWTERCRRQATVSARLVALLDDLPARLGDRDNTRRRSAWCADVEAVAAAVADLPGLPFDQGLADALNDEYPHAADFDLKVRDAMSDPSRAALDLIAGCLLQVARGLLAAENLGGAGARLADGVKRLNEGRSDVRLPDFAGVGALLPDELDGLVSSRARLLAARGRGFIEPSELRALPQAVLEARLRMMSVELGERSVFALTRRLAEGSVALQASALSQWADAPDLLSPMEIACAVDLDAWASAEQAVVQWSSAEKEAAGFATKATLVPVSSGCVLPMGLTIWSATAGVIVASPADIESAAINLGLPLLPSPYQRRADQLLSRLVEASSDMVRNENRPPGWPPATFVIDLPNADMQPDDPDPWAVALDAFRKLRDCVRTQSPGDTLAATVANIDPSLVSRQQSSLVELVATLRLAAMSADLVVAS